MPTATITKVFYSGASGNVEFPKTLQTPSGIALLEIQGIIHIGDKQLTGEGGFSLDSQTEDEKLNLSEPELVGEFIFSNDNDVVLNVGKYQRLRGSIQKLKKPLALVKIEDPDRKIENEDENREMKLVEIIYHKLVFSAMPEPIVYKE